MRFHRVAPPFVALIVVILTMTMTPAHAQYGGTQGFVIDPPVINTGSSVSMLGTGCDDEPTVVFTIEPLGITLGETTAAPNGDFFLPDVVLDLSPGVYPVTATCGDVVMVAQVTVLALGAGIGVDTDGDGIPDQVAITGAGTLIIKAGLALLCAGLFFLLVTRQREDDAPHPAPA